VQCTSQSHALVQLLTLLQCQAICTDDLYSVVYAHSHRTHFYTLLQERWALTPAVLALLLARQPPGGSSNLPEAQPASGRRGSAAGQLSEQHKADARSAEAALMRCVQGLVQSALPPPPLAILKVTYALKYVVSISNPQRTRKCTTAKVQARHSTSSFCLDHVCYIRVHGGNIML
jgi:hypothetical protein